MSNLRQLATHIIAFAMMLRALVPVGWMPDTAAAHPAAMVPCPMMDGMRGMPIPSSARDQAPAKHHLPPSHEGSICPFATAAQPTRIVEPQQIETARPHFVFFVSNVSILATDWDHVPRAPPVQGNTTII